MTQQCREGTSAGVRDRLLADLNEHCHGRSIRDDVTLVVVKAVETSVPKEVGDAAR